MQVSSTASKGESTHTEQVAAQPQLVQKVDVQRTLGLKRKPESDPPSLKDSRVKIREEEAERLQLPQTTFANSNRRLPMSSFHYLEQWQNKLILDFMQLRTQACAQVSNPAFRASFARRLEIFFRQEVMKSISREDIDQPLLRILETSLRTLPTYEEYFYVLDQLIHFATLHRLTIPEGYNYLFTRLASTATPQCPSDKSVVDRMDRWQRLIEMENFPQIWPALQRHFLAEKISKASLQKFFIKVAYHHPHTVLLPESMQLVKTWSRLFQTKMDVTETQLYGLSVVVHYAPQLLPAGLKFEVTAYKGGAPIFWQSIYLLQERLSTHTLQNLRTRFEIVNSGTSFPELIEVTLRQEYLWDRRSIELCLEALLNQHFIKPYSSFALLRLSETLAQKAIQEKFMPPLQYLQQLVEQIPPSPRLASVCLMLYAKRLLDVSKFV